MPLLGLSRLLIHALSDRSPLPQLRRAERFYRKMNDLEFLVDSPQALDAALLAEFDYLAYGELRPPSEGNSLVSALQHLNPTLRTQVPMARRALTAWRFETRLLPACSLI